MSVYSPSKFHLTVRPGKGGLQKINLIGGIVFRFCANMIISTPETPTLEVEKMGELDLVFAATENHPQIDAESLALYHAA